MKNPFNNIVDIGATHKDKKIRKKIRKETMKVMKKRLSADRRPEVHRIAFLMEEYNLEFNTAFLRKYSGRRKKDLVRFALKKYIFQKHLFMQGETNDIAEAKTYCDFHGTSIVPIGERIKGSS